MAVIRMFAMSSVMQELLAQSSFDKLKEGEIVPGTITEIRQNEVVVDIGGKSEGVIPANEFIDIGDLQIGATIDVFVEKLEDKNGAPRVLAKGTGLVAAKIRELAAEHRIPTLEAPPLARALYQHVELGHEIPAELYTAVAEVLAWVFQLRSWRSGWGVEPTAPKYLPVSAALDPQAKTAAQGA